MVAISCFTSVGRCRSTTRLNMPNSVIAALMPLTGENVTYGNDRRQLACGPVVAAGHINAAIESVVPTLQSLVGNSTVLASRLPHLRANPDPRLEP